MQAHIQHNQELTCTCNIMYNIQYVVRMLTSRIYALCMFESATEGNSHCLTGLKYVQGAKYMYVAAYQLLHACSGACTLGEQ